MASLFKLSDGTWVAAIYKQGRVRLGKHKGAASFLFAHIEELETSKKLGVDPRLETATWLESKATKYMREKLVKFGLIEIRQKRTLSDACEIYCMDCGTKNTEDSKAQAVRCLERYFKDTPISEIKYEDALKYKAWLSEFGRVNAHPTKGHRLAQNTVTLRINAAKAIFQIAVDDRWIQGNPFKKVKALTVVDRTNHVEIPITWFDKIIGVLSCPQEKAMVGLLRIGGMRPSEVYYLSRSDVNLESGDIDFRSVKTERLTGRDRREMPIFGKLRPIIIECLQSHSETLVCPKLYDWGGNSNRHRENACGELRRNLSRWFKLAGLPQIPEIPTNMRRSQSSYVMENFGPVCESLWIGHSSRVAIKNYGIVTEKQKENARKCQQS